MQSTFEVKSPIDNSVYATRAYASADAIETCLSQCQSVQRQWQQTPLSQRKTYCEKAVAWLLKNAPTIAEEICWQMGRPIQYAANELNGLAERAQYMIDCAEQSLAEIVCDEISGFQRYIKREPLGTILVIAPWNYPFLTAVNAIIPALLAGNTVILKHSAQTPLVAERFYQSFEQAGLPPGVFQFLHLTHRDSESLIQNHHINGVVFTGSVTGGKHIEQAALGRFIPVNLELGGKDPAYIRHDADLTYAVETVIDGAMFNSGQSCCGIERIYVHRDCYDDFIQQAKAVLQTYKLGPSHHHNTTIGPMINAKSADFVRTQVQQAVKDGATSIVDKAHFRLDTPGSAYKAPELLINVNHHMRIMTEESFGPVVGVMVVDSDEQAIELMNDSHYGLTASVFSQDIEKAIAIGEHINTGTFFVNRCDYLDPALAWTGVKDSGRGCALSVLGYGSLTRPKSFHIKHL